MSKRSPQFFIQDILACIERVENYIGDLDKEKFTKDEKTIDAVIRNLEIIGEAAKNVPEEIRNNSKQIPWKKIVGFRNIVIHEYFFVDLQNIWFIIKDQLPQLKTQIQQLLKEYNN